MVLNCSAGLSSQSLHQWCGSAVESGLVQHKRIISPLRRCWGGWCWFFGTGCRHWGLVRQTVKGVNRGIGVRGDLLRLLHDIKPHELLVLFILTGLGDRRGKRRAQLLHCRLEAMKAAVAVALRVRSAVHISFLLKKVFFC